MNPDSFRDSDLCAVDSPYGPALVMENPSGRWKLKRRRPFRQPKPSYDPMTMAGLRAYVSSTFGSNGFTASTTWL